MATMRVDVLKRKILAGKVVAVSSYHYDDITTDSGHSAHDRVPVSFLPKDWKDKKEGVFYVLESDVEPGSRATKGNPLPDGSVPVHLRVHSNCNYDFLVLP